MSDWKLHTPKGVNDILPEECTHKKEIEDTIWSVFASFGYKEVETPMFEYYDCFAGAGGQISQESMFKFFDDQGRILTLRPDITTSIARMTATKLEGEERPLRFCYTGNVFRADKTEGARQREFTQSGIELIGSYSPKADAEVIAAAIEAASAVGIEELHMEIGQVAFFAGLTEQAGLSREDIEKLRERIDSKDTTGIKNIIKNLDMDESVKAVMVDLPYLFGGAEVIDRANVPGLNEKSKKALENLKSIYDFLCLYGMEQFVSIDLGMLQSIDYYTGSIFKCYTYGVGFPICAGGRYDTLMEKFGKKEGAVGVAFGINRVISALGKNKKSANPSGTLIFAEKNAEGIAYDIAYNLRIGGILSELYIGDGDYKEADSYAEKAGHDSMIRVFADGKVMIKDYAKSEIIETMADEFLNFYEDDCEDEHCSCGHEHHHHHAGECGCGHEKHGHHGENCSCGHYE